MQPLHGRSATAVKTAPAKPFKLDDYLAEMSQVILDEVYPAEFVLSDDIWNKFEFPHTEHLSADAILTEVEMDSTMLSSLLSLNDLCEIRNHDCMWAGHCGSKEHPADEQKHSRPLLTPVLASARSSVSVPPGRSLLLKAQVQSNPVQMVQAPAPSTPALPSLDSPPNSDDEESKVKVTETLQLLQDAISECDLEDDSDLYDYFEDEDIIAVDEDDDDEDEEKPQRQQQKQPAKAASASVTTSDHCYHKDKNDTMRMNNLGVETPSDSEEEIDVVSVGDKQTASSRMASSLPNNPSSRDKQQLQRTMASAINHNGIKTLLPRKPSSGEHSPPGKRRGGMEARGMKRTKHRALVAPYKKRSYNHSSDSEPEPSEKRNMHNNMERQRRIDLRNAFEDLRMLVPEVSKRERAPKVVILREAAVYCGRLGGVQHAMLKEVDELKRLQRRLRSNVSHLRVSLASKHR